MNSNIKIITLGLLMAAAATQPLQGMNWLKQNWKTVVGVTAVVGGLGYLGYRYMMKPDFQLLLHEAVWKNDLNAVKNLIKEGADVNTTINIFDDSALHFATSLGHTNIIKYLIEQNADMNITNKAGETPLHHATKSDNIDLVKYFAEQGADINAIENDGATPLYVAAQRGYTEIVKFLIEQGADINKTDNNGLYVYDIAMMATHYDIATYLGNCHYYLNNCTLNNCSKVVVTTQNQHLVPSNLAYAAIAIREKNITDMQNLIPIISNFKFDYFIKLTERENISQANLELKKMKELSRRNMFMLLKKNGQACDAKFNFTNLQ